MKGNFSISKYVTDGPHGNTSSQVRNQFGGLKVNGIAPPIDTLGKAVFRIVHSAKSQLSASLRARNNTLGPRANA